MHRRYPLLCLAEAPNFAFFPNIISYTKITLSLASDDEWNKSALLLNCWSVRYLPKVLEYLQYFLDCLINIHLSPSKQCRFMEDIHAAHTSFYLQITLVNVSVELNIVLRGEWMTILFGDRKRSIVMESALLNECSKDFCQRLYIYEED